jgi:hypothetical protein
MNMTSLKWRIFLLPTADSLLRVSELSLSHRSVTTDDHREPSIPENHGALEFPLPPTFLEARKIAEK